jgi:cell division protein ZapA
MKQSVTVEIAGQVLSIRSDEGPEYVQELADYVDAHLRQIGGQIGGEGGMRRTYSLQRVALLVAMQIADELFREKDLRQRYRTRVEARLEALEAAISAHEVELEALEPAAPPSET